MNDPVAISLRPSRNMVVFLILGHVLTIVTAFIGLPPAAATIVSAALALSLVAQLRTALLKQPDAVIALEIIADGSLRYRSRDGAWHPATLNRPAYARPWLIIVRIATLPRGARRVVLLADSAEAEQLRRLRVWLLWGRTAPVHADDGPG